jgi:hypothetical protein
MQKTQSKLYLGPNTVREAIREKRGREKRERERRERERLHTLGSMAVH